MKLQKMIVALSFLSPSFLCMGMGQTSDAIGLTQMNICWVKVHGCQFPGTIETPKKASKVLQIIAAKNKQPQISQESMLINIPKETAPIQNDKRPEQPYFKPSRGKSRKKHSQQKNPVPIKKSCQTPKPQQNIPSQPLESFLHKNQTELTQHPLVQTNHS